MVSSLVLLELCSYNNQYFTILLILYYFSVHILINIRFFHFYFMFSLFHIVIELHFLIKLYKYKVIVTLK